MNYASLPDIPSLQHVRELNSAVVDADAAILAAEQEVLDIEQRRTPLRERLAGLDAAAADQPTVDTSLVDALVADPTAAPDMDALRDTVSAARKAADIHNLQKNVIQQAIDKIGEDVAAATLRVETARQNRDAAWTAFVRAAHLYLGDQLQTEVEHLRVTVIEPMLEFQKLGSVWNQEAVVDHRAPRLDGDFKIKVRRYEEYTPVIPVLRNIPMPVGDYDPERASPAQASEAKPQFRFKEHVLYPLPQHKAELIAETAIERLRASLAS